MTDLVRTHSPSVLPYACGHNDCWPSDLETGRTRFATSGELAEHNKSTHAAQPCERPFKCALNGCGKSWKVRTISLALGSPH